MRPRHRLRCPTLSALALGAVVLAAWPVRAAAPVAPPAPAHFVTDQAQFLSPATAQALDRRLSDYQRGTGHQVLLWIGHTTNGEPIETWAVRTFAAWRVGRQGIDDGVVLFVMADDRKLRIEVGYGLEERLPDIRAARIIREQITPRLKAGDRDGAAQAGVGAILQALGGDGQPAAERTPDQAPQAHLGLGELIVLGIVGLLLLGFIVTHPGLALLLLTNLGSGGRRSGSGWGGGGFGGGGGGFSGGGGRSGGGGASGSW
jgi:uncharacterized protein